MNKYLLLIIISGFASALKAQNKDTTLIRNGLYTYDALDQRIEGKIYVNFTVDANGNLLNESIKVIKGLGYGMDELAVNALKNAPKFKPAGESVRYTLPIVISLNAVKDKEWSEYYAIKGNKFFEQKQCDSAITYYDKAIKKNKKNFRALYGLYKVYETKGDSTNAIIYRKKAGKSGR